MERKILHIDVNNAFLSWTAIEKIKNGENLDIRIIPAVIGGDESQRKGVVLAKSMKAKQFGIITGETLYSARKKCPNLKIYQGDYKVYKKYSDQLYQLLLGYTDKIERYSIDECFLDLTQFLKGESIIKIANKISKRVKKELGFTVNIGVSNNKLLAKMASDFEKPDKVHTLFQEEIQEKMWNLPVADLFMVGKKSIPQLQKLGIKTIGDLAKKDIRILNKKFGKHGNVMWEYANGIDNAEVISEELKPKCIGNSVTLPYDEIKIEKLEEVLLALTEQVTYRLRKSNLLAKVVNVQLKTKEFKVYSHQRKLFVATNSTKEIYTIAKELLHELHQKEWIRLIGVRVDSLVEYGDEEQISFFNIEKEDKQEKLDKTIDILKEKYGYEKITRAGEMKVYNMINRK